MDKKNNVKIDSIENVYKIVQNKILNTMFEITVLSGRVLVKNQDIVKQH